ncbi:hypothetical protein ACILDU_11015 [Capnocytophaga canimorsus]|uniref:hypothetical protein n=1 Tax=Capnocytophaga canimorsus TaxID=28188 RepID=UPI0037D7D541
MKPTKKRTKLTLSEVETQMEVLTKEEIDTLRGGGNGTYGSPYTQDEYYALFDTNSFYGGYVAGWGYVNPLEGVEVTGSSFGSYTPPNSDFNDRVWSEYEAWKNQMMYGSSNGYGSQYDNGYGSYYYGSDNNEPIYGPEQYVGGGGGSSSSHYSNNNDNDPFNFSQTISDLWNSTVARVIVPDVLSFNLSTSATAIIGVNFEFSVNFITRGNDASLIPTITFSPGAQVGAGVSADALVGVSRGYFSVTDVRTLQEGESIGRIGGWSIDGVLNAGSGGGGAINASIGLNEKGEVIFFKFGASAGVSIGGGLSLGGSHTLIVKP